MTRKPRRSRRRFAPLLVSLLALVAGWPALAAGQEDERPATNDVAPATLSFWNREIAVLRDTYRERSPAERVEAAQARLAALPEVGVVPTLRLDLVDGGSGRRALLRAGSDPLFGLGEGDLDPDSATTLERAGEAALARLQEALAAREAQRQWPHLLRSLALAVVATALFALLAWGLLRLRRRALDRLHAAIDRRLGRPSLSGFDFTQALLGLERFAVRGAGFALLATLAYLWLAFVLSRFPFTQPWGTRLGEYLTERLASLALGFVGAIPGVFTVAVIFLVTRAVAQLAAQFFDAVEQRRIEIGWLEPETVRATRRLVGVLIWVFALTVAYPHIPGSSSDAFKGVSVFVGLMVSLGSAGMVNQVMSGLVAVYSRALKPGDYVRVGEHEGLITEVGLLSTKMHTRRREEITIPNAVLVGTSSVNYSRLAGEQGAIVATSVTIGYDSPWRQVHALLLLAAERTPALRREPRPRVLQRALSDFYVEYQLLAHLDRPEERLQALSDLHAQIQDAFNEFGVQIMSPNFEAQPAEPVLVPRERWHDAPARPSDAG